MSIIKGIILESDEYYSDIEKKIRKRLSILPGGSIKKRKIGSNIYYYLQSRKGNKVVHKYIGKSKPIEMINSIIEKKKLMKELKRVIENRGVLRRRRSKKSGRNSR